MLSSVPVVGKTENTPGDGGALVTIVMEVTAIRLAVLVLIAAAEVTMSMRLLLSSKSMQCSENVRLAAAARLFGISTILLGTSWRPSR